MNLNILAPDKIQHMISGCVVALVCMPLGEPIALGFVAIAALGKEVYDRVSGKGNPEALDAIATLGAGIATIGIHTYF